MNWFNFNSKKRGYSISIKAIAKEFGISIDIINILLKDAGYNPMQLAFSNLNDKHLQVILLAYVHSVKSLYKEANNNFRNYNLKEQKELRDFFGKFIRKSFFSSEITIQINDKILPARNGKIYKSDLDNELITDYFFKRIRQLEFEQENLSFHFDDFHDWNDLFVDEQITVNIARPSFIYSQLNWTVKVKHIFNDIKSRIFTTVITGHYYIFSAEEDLKTTLLPSIVRCFSVVKKELGEAFKNINLKSNPKWKITFNLL